MLCSVCNKNTAVVFVNKGLDHLAIRRESLDDLIKNQL